MSTIKKKSKKVSKCRSKSCVNNEVKDGKSNLSSLKDKLLDLYYNHKEKCDHLWIDGVISDMTTNYSRVYDQLAEFSKNDKKALIIHYNSTGGSSTGGNLLYNVIKMFKKPTIAVNELDCMSAATYSFLGCDLRIAKPYSAFLIHQTRYGSNPHGGTKTFKELRRDNYGDEMYYQLSKNFYQQHTKLTIKEVKDLLRSDKILSADECLKMGLVDHIFQPNRVKQLKTSAKSEVREIMFSTFNNDMYSLIKPEILLANNLKSIVVYIDDSYVTFEEALLFINLMIEIAIPINFVYLTSIQSYVLLMGLFTKHSIILKSRSDIGWTPTNMLKHGLSIGGLEDNMKAVMFYRQCITSILKSKAKLPKNIMDEIFDKTYTWSMEDGVKYGLVDEIMDPGKNKELIIDDELDKPLIATDKEKDGEILMNMIKQIKNQIKTNNQTSQTSTNAA